MKVVNVDFVENEMVEMDVVQIGQIEIDGGDGCDCGSGECGDKCGDGCAEKTSPSPHPFPPLPPSHILFLINLNLLFNLSHSRSL